VVDRVLSRRGANGVVCFNLLGDGLRDIVDPQRRT
jgi:hypothetical protein